MRRLALTLAQNAGFNSTEAGKAAIVATELSTNILRHAGHGQLLLRPMDEEPDQGGLELMALDRGPGLADPAQCFQDGFSTAGGSGTGLGAIRRLASCFDFYSRPVQGTVLMAQLWADPGFRPRSPLELGTVCVPMAGEVECGDAWAVRAESPRPALLLADGLGHGPLAARAANEAVRAFLSSPRCAPAEFLQGAHAVLRPTRGASVAVAEIHPERGVLQFSGVGNISGSIIDGTASRSVVSHNGTLGHEVHRIQEFQYPWSGRSLLVLHSDGLTTRWQLEAYPGLRTCHPSVIAGVLYRDFQRGRDDATVLVARERPA